MNLLKLCLNAPIWYLVYQMYCGMNVEVWYKYPVFRSVSQEEEEELLNSCIDRDARSEKRYALCRV